MPLLTPVIPAPFGSLVINIANCYSPEQLQLILSEHLHHSLQDKNISEINFNFHPCNFHYSKTPFIKLYFKVEEFNKQQNTYV